MTKPRMDIFLSDLHIGIDAESNLYKKELHEPKLKAILKFIQETKDYNIRNVIILGDWIDLWMYTTDAEPTDKSTDDKTDINKILPTAEQIFKANPKIFTKQDDNSDFISCIENISGGFHYVNGNHDITVTEEEIKSFLPPDSKCKITWHDKEYFQHGIYGCHGHEFSMVCKSPEKGLVPLNLPFGYYMTRYAADFKIKVPNLNLNELGKGDFSEAMLKMIYKDGNTIKDRPFKLDKINITMPKSDNSVVKKYYTGNEIVNMFPDSNTGSKFNEDEFIKTDVLTGLDNLRSSASSKFSDNNDIKVVVMGHTHDECFYDSPYYVNTGFLCGDKENGKSPTFVGIDINTHDVTVFEVDNINKVNKKVEILRERK